MNCSNCNHTNPTGASFCNNCGQKLNPNCVQCGKENPVGSKFCNGCGNNLQSAANSSKLTVNNQQQENLTINTNNSRKLNAAPFLRGAGGRKSQPKAAERRQLTCLFCDLVGSTALSEQLDAEDFRQVILDYQKIAEGVINENGGHIAQYLGDGLLVYFGYPKGLENAPKAAVQAGLGIIAAVAKANQERTQKGLVEMNIRIGIHTGLVVVDDHLALGDTVNITARLEGLAPVNSLVISPHTLKLVRGWFAVKSLGKEVLKGIKEPLEIFQVIKASGANSSIEIAMGRGLSPLVGRETEVYTMLHNWKLAKEGKGQLLLLNGEAGIGKSRLIENIKAQVKQEKNVAKLVLRCSDYHVNSAFYPLIDILEKRILQFEKEENTESKVDKLIKWFDFIGIEKNPNLPIFADFLAIPISEGIRMLYENALLVAGGKRKKFMEGFSTAFFNFALKQPLLLIVEDLHWMDSSTLDWLNQLVENINEYPLFILATTRPQFQATWTDKNYTSQLDLQRLNTDRIEAICYHQTKGKTLPAEILAQIKEKTDGVPLFVEELTRMIIESNLLIEKETHYELNPANKKGFALSVPSTLQDSLITRLDSLSGSREIAQIGAVLGRSFTFDLLQAVAEKDTNILQEYLAQLVSAELLFRKDYGGELTYIFKHALIQDTAYETLLRSRRQQLHQRVVSVLEKQFPEIVETRPQLLAHHLTEAGLKTAALNMWEIAAKKANAQNAAIDAMHHFQKALSLIESIADESKREEKELALLLPYNGVLMLAKSWGNAEAGKNGLRILELCDKQNNPVLSCVGYFGIGISNSAKGQTKKSIEYFQKGLAIAKGNKELDFRPLFTAMIAYRQMILGDYNEGSATCQLALNSYQKEKHQFLNRFGIGDVWFYSMNTHFCISHITGHIDKAREILAESREKVKNHKRIIDIHRIHFMEVNAHYFEKDWASLNKVSQTFLPSVSESGELSVFLYWSYFESVSAAAKGSLASYKKTRKILQGVMAAGMVVHQDWLLSWLASACLVNNWIEEGLACIDEAIKISSQIEDYMYSSHVYQVQGDLLLAAGKTTAAEQVYLQAIEIAQKQSAKWFELLASKALARLWQSQRKTAEAYEVLNGVYSWFTEGFDTMEMLEAKGLLAEWKKVKI